MPKHAQPKTKIALILSVLLLATTASRIEGAQGGALVKNEWLKLAKFTKNMAKVPPRARQLISQRYGTLKQLQLLHARAAAYTQFSNDNVTRASWLPIVIAIAQTLEDLSAELPDKAQQAIEAAAAAEFVRGGIAEFFSVATGAYNAASRGCITTGAAADAGAASVVGTIAGLAADAPDLEPTTTTGGSEELNGIGPNGFDDLKTNHGLGNSGLSDAANCNLFKAESGGLLSGGAINAKMYFALGYLGKDTADATSTAADATNLDAVPSTQPNQPLRYYKAAYNAVKKLKQGTAFAPQPIDPKKITSLKNSQSFKTAVKNVLLGQDGDYIASDEPAVTNKINQVYKEQDSDFQEQF
uniref:Variant surface glycoprotein 1591 n=1 Tax=Trypanosoma brucei TaxID=5691 RepID=M4T0I5_9TRYP|nr:variant surface glycoprotein 1591 [Trypanosoma brucei]